MHLTKARYINQLRTFISLHVRPYTYEPKAPLSFSAGTFDEARLREYMALGVTRFSVGVQVRRVHLVYVCWAGGMNQGLEC